MDGYGDIIGLLFWLLFLYLLIHPWAQMKGLKNARLRLIRLIEEKYGWRVITMIHRQEKIGFLGLPVYRYIDIEDSEAVIRAIRNTPPGTTIALILHTPGGLVLAASQIAMALKRHKGKKIVIVPHYAMSGGTLIALAADEIIMDPDAVLGPLDPQLQTPKGVFPAPSLIKVAEMRKDKASDETLIYADIAGKALEEIRKTIIDLLKDKMPVEKAEKIAEELTAGYYTHDYPITVDHALKMGLPIKTNVPPEVYTLMELFPQAIQQRPGVEYVPRPQVPYYHGGRQAK
jgi:ClpP class serine protease